MKGFDTPLLPVFLCEQFLRQIKAGETFDSNISTFYPPFLKDFIITLNLNQFKEKKVNTKKL